MTFKLLSYNIRKGKGNKKPTPILLDIAQFIDQLDCDIVFCQEIAEYKTGTCQSQCCDIADTIKLNHHYGANAHYAHGNHGNAIFSAFETKQHRNLNVSTSPFEHRGILYATVVGPLKKPVHLFNVHFGLTPRQRKKQLHLLLSYIDREVSADEAVVIAGDFNDLGGRIDQFMQAQGSYKNALHAHSKKDRKTFPSHRPLFCLDHVFYRHLTVRKAAVLDGPTCKSLSDHLAIQVIFQEL